MELVADPTLPSLREDLTITPGAPLLSGAPSWVIYDPIRHRYFQIGQRTIGMISCWSAGTVGKLLARLRRERAIEVAPEEVEAVIHFLTGNNLTVETRPGTAKRLSDTAGKQRERLWLWAAHRYVFFRVPLVRPQRMLEATLPWVRPFLTRGFVLLTLVALVLALYLAGRLWSDVLAHARASFTLSGAWIYVPAIAFVKVLHELGHAYQAVSRGLRVPVMGVAFIVLFPLLYTDVSDGWRLRKRRDRVMIDAAGIMTELVVASYATLLWCFLPDGAVRSAVFAVATVSWVFSLLVNLNPFMRFDGYYLLADALGIHNLQPRANALGRWALRRALFGLKEAPPEKPSRRMTVFMVIYAYCVWVYRFFLFLGIALLVYAITFKALGILLFVVEIAIFIGRPIYREVQVWFSMWERIVMSSRSWLTLSVLLGFLLLAFWPMPGRILAPAIIEQAEQQLVFPPGAARVDAIFVTEGAVVEEGAPLVQFEDPTLSHEIAQSETRIEMQEARILSGAGDAVERAERLVHIRRLEEERVRLQALKLRRDDLLVTAELSGRVVEMVSDVTPGVWVGRERPIARIVGMGDVVVRGLIEDEDRRRLDPEGTPKFVPEDVSLPSVDFASFEIGDVAIETLPDGYLSAAQGGRVDVATGAAEAEIPVGVWYPLTASMEGVVPEPIARSATAHRGNVVLITIPDSVASRIARRVARIFIREIGL